MAEQGHWEGQQLGNYRLLQVLGRGHWASVYLGEHQHLHTQAAIKVLHDPLAPAQGESFLTEARTLARLRHPYIVRILDFGLQEDIPFLVMDYAPGGTLRTLHPKGMRLPLSTVLSYVKQVAAALQYAHEQRLIHRDLKPENLLLGPEQQLWLSDFGLAIMAHSARSQSFQQAAGTPAYMAPEQLQGHPTLASDQYALGVLVYEWLCGERPFAGSLFEIAHQHTSVLPPSLREKIPTLPLAVEQVVLRALAKDPQSRFARVQDLAWALEETCKSASSSEQTLLLHSSEHSAAPVPTVRHKLPVPLTSLIGREQEVAAICALLSRPEVRLLTLLGAGGIGKTRLALQVATQLRASFVDGICFVHLASVTEPELMVPTIAEALGLREGPREGSIRANREDRGQALFEQVTTYLHEKKVLLLLDNFEQVVLAAPHVENLLVTCPSLKILVTSRAVLHVQGEHEFPLPPLALPPLTQLPEEEVLLQYGAIALFVQRVRATLPTFQLTSENARAIAEICVRLDGLPLALELAAARMKLLPPQALLTRLSQRFEVLTGGPQTLPARQQTLRNTLQWSYDLLKADEQRLFRRLSVFVSGWTLEAAEAVWAAREKGSCSLLDGMASLLDKSLLLQVEPEGEEPRFVMLETVREYGLACLRELGELESIQQVHAKHYLSWVEQAAPHLKGRHQTTWLSALEREQDNLRGALGWLIEHEETELALRFCEVLWRFWYLRGYWKEGREWLTRALQLPSTGQPTVARARALYSAGDLAFHQDDKVVARLLLEESVTICRRLATSKELAIALGALGVLLDKDDPTTACSLLKESEAVCRTLDSTWELAYLLCKLASLAWWKRKLIEASTQAQEALRLAQTLGDKSLIADALATLSHIAYRTAERQDDLKQLIAFNQERFALAQELDDKYRSAIALQNIGYYSVLQGDLTQAALIHEGLKLARELGAKLSINVMLHSAGYVAERQGNLAEATGRYQQGLALAQELGDEMEVGWHLVGLASVAAAEGHWYRAAHLLGAAEQRLDVEVNMNTVERVQYDHLIEKVRTQLGKTVFTTAWAAGRTMTVEQALAVQQLPAPVPAAQPKGVIPYPDGLTPRETEVLRLLVQGLTSTQIAERLVIGLVTVNSHMRSIYNKLGVTSRAAATRYALEHHLL